MGKIARERGLFQLKAAQASRKETQFTNHDLAGIAPLSTASDSHAEIQPLLASRFLEPQRKLVNLR
jgi:hypothetical protein